MRRTTMTVAGAVVATAIPLYAAPAAAAPLSQSLSQSSALNDAETATVQQVQYRRWNRNRGYSLNGGYYAYGAAPGYRRWGFGAQAPSPGSSPACATDRDQNSAFPSWMCR
jgi:hypothetical protein